MYISRRSIFSGPQIPKSNPSLPMKINSEPHIFNLLTFFVTRDSFLNHVFFVFFTLLIVYNDKFICSLSEYSLCITNSPAPTTKDPFLLSLKKG